VTRAEVLAHEDEVASWVEDGMTIAVGGFILSSHPMALLRAVARSGVRGLTVVASASASVELDLLIGAGCVSKVIAPYVGAESHAGIAPLFKRAAEQGDVHVWEVDEWMYYAGLRAGAQGLPSMPCRGLVGTSYPDVNQDLVPYLDPVTGDELIAVPAIRPDVCFLHAAHADVYGNVQHVGTGFGDRALFNASVRTAVQVEQVISNEQVRADPYRTSLPYVDAVVRAPFGAHPFASPSFYREDTEHLTEYLSAAAGGPEQLDAYFNRYVSRPLSHLGYLEEIGLVRLLGLHEF
jgi:glutaconate CoA-transferase subunit A